MKSMVILSGIVMLLAAACATAPPAPDPARAAAPLAPLPQAFMSDDFVVVLAKEGDTPESLAAR